MFIYHLVGWAILEFLGLVLVGLSVALFRASREVEGIPIFVPVACGIASALFTLVVAIHFVTQIVNYSHITW